MVAATTSYPPSTSSAAATELSTPPDMATRTRSLTRPPHPGAECGVRNAELTGRVRSPQSVSALYARAFDSALRTPHSALESPMQDGGQVPDLLHDLRQGSDERLHVFRRILLAEREAQRRDPQLARHAHGREHVRRLDRSRAASGARRAGDPGEVQMHQQRLAVRAGHGHLGYVRRPGRVRGVDHGVRHHGYHPAAEAVAHRRSASREVRLLPYRQLDRLSQPDDPGHVLRPGANAELLATAVDDGLDRVAVAPDQRADPPRSAELVARDPDQGAARLRERDRDLAEGLAGVHPERGGRRAATGRT